MPLIHTQVISSMTKIMNINARHNENLPVFCFIGQIELSLSVTELQNMILLISTV